MFLEPEKNLAQFHIDPGMKVADMGAGTGFYAFLISPTRNALAPACHDWHCRAGMREDEEPD
jgi:predicted methyltransferase